MKGERVRTSDECINGEIYFRSDSATPAPGPAFRTDHLRFITAPSPLSFPLRFLPMMSHHRGDDLEDDFMLDETVALSEDEAIGSSVGDQDDIGKLLSADEEERDIEPPTERTKGLLDEKKRRRKEKEKERRAKESPL